MENKMCKICGRHAAYKYYNVRACEGCKCKQFFRRAVIHKREYICMADGNCQINAGPGSCLGCKLEKCLLEGMEPRMVERKIAKISEEFLRRLMERKNYILWKRWLFSHCSGELSLFPTHSAADC